MTTTQQDAPEELERLNANLTKVEELSQRLLNAISHKRQIHPSLHGPGHDLFMKAAAAYVADTMANPSKILEHQIAYWGKTLKHYVDAQQQMLKGQLTRVPPDPTPRDRRFSNPLWDTHPYFNYIKQQYLMTSAAIEEAVGDLPNLSPRDRQRVEYFSRQLIDMLSPTNFLGTNPDALSKAVETEGQSLVDGLENLVRDLEANQGDLVVTLADANAFKLGENIATSDGAVVFRNRMLELIQYAPSTEMVRRTPIVIFPPWINKFYVMDLKPQNSLVRWLVGQGFTVFMVSWVNPDPSFGDVGLEGYVRDGYLAAIGAAREISGEDRVNAVGYCIGGTTLALTLALLHKRNDKSVRSATFFTTLTDFSDQGEMGVFLTDDFVDGIEEEVTEKGILSSFIMSRTFSFLRSNDLIYGPAIRSYMMGEPPPAFDLLFWNGDSTNLPGRMSVEYLRGLCQEDRFAKGTFKLCGETLSLKDVQVPLCAIGCETDHIAAWKASYSGVRQMGSKEKTFIMSESGHIAGIINPPGRKKYGHFLNTDWPESADDWRAGASHHEGSWWPVWGEWLTKRSGALIPARVPGDSGHPVIAKAPGTYVLSRSKP